jgi:hypothetical protein
MPEIGDAINRFYGASMMPEIGDAINRFSTIQYIYFTVIRN